MFVALEVARAFLRKNGKSAYEKCARNHKAWPREMSSRKFLETFLVNLGSAMKYMGGALTDLFPDVLTSLFLIANRKFLNGSRNYNSSFQDQVYLLYPR